jgi:hypothetical protein
MFMYSYKETADSPGCSGAIILAMSFCGYPFVSHASADDTCETCPSIDARRWHREGLLQPGQSFEVAWACDGEPAADRLSGENANGDSKPVRTSENAKCPFQNFLSL